MAPGPFPVQPGRRYSIGATYLVGAFGLGIGLFWAAVGWIHGPFRGEGLGIIAVGAVLLLGAAVATVAGRSVRVEIALQHPTYALGERLRGTVRLVPRRRVRLRRAAIHLVCRERMVLALDDHGVIWERGVVDGPRLKQDAVVTAKAQTCVVAEVVWRPMELRLDLVVPPSAPPTWVGVHHALEWRVEVELGLRSGRRVRAEAPVTVRGEVIG